MILVLIIVALTVLLFLWMDDFAYITESVIFGVLVGGVIAVFVILGAHAVWDIGNYSAKTATYQIESIEFVGDNAVITTPDTKVVIEEYDIILDGCEVNTWTQRIESPKFMPWLPEFGVLDQDDTICIDVNSYTKQAGIR